MKTRCFVAILFLFLLASCSSVEGPDFSGMPPAVTGISITSEAGHLLGTWGNPTDGSDDGSLPRNSSGLQGVFPNPCRGKCTIHYRLGISARVNLTVVSARAGNALQAELQPLLGAQMPVSGMKTVRTLNDSEVFQAGDFAWSWDGNDDAGNPVPSGFYRVILSVDGVISWRDMFLFRNIEDLPASLLNI